MDFTRDGACYIPGALGEDDLRALETALNGVASGRAGVRLHGIAPLRPLLATDGVIGAGAAALLGPTCRPVRAILFDKSAGSNWALGWHQDRTIAVAERVEVPGFGPWSHKDGLLHVEPPFALLERMVTLRVHLDPVSPGNAPLRIAPGSHRLGRLPEAEIDAVVARCGTYDCLAASGDIWAYATPILHASKAAKVPARRRVLQVDYSMDALPDRLRWLGV